MGVANRGSYQRANATNLFNMWTGWVRCVPSMLCCSLGPLPKVLSQILDRAFYGSRNQGTKKPVPSLWLHSEPHSRDPAFPCSCAIVSWESHLRSSSIGLDSKCLLSPLCRKSTSRCPGKSKSVCSSRKPCRRQRQALLPRHQKRAAFW